MKEKETRQELTEIAMELGLLSTKLAQISEAVNKQMFRVAQILAQIRENSERKGA